MVPHTAHSSIGKNGIPRRRHPAGCTLRHSPCASNSRPAIRGLLSLLQKVHGTHRGREQEAPKEGHRLRAQLRRDGC
uniref:Uncharacterized protein n=1 Tax=Arundo donax TaxID=35708 RepID=A0A0A8YAM1_ARUDO